MGSVGAGGRGGTVVHHDGVTSLVGEALRRRCIEAVAEEGERIGVLLLRLWGRPADATVDGDPAAEALLRGR
jgi:hypothetical protein